MSLAAAQPVVPSPQHKSKLATQPWHAEFDLLLACCAEPSDEREARIRAILQRPMDWQCFTEAAEHHGVVPRVDENLSRNADLVPREALATIHQIYQANARRTLWLTRELGRVLEHFQLRGIPALPYKGPVLAQSLYGNVTERQFSDLDVLIHASDFSRAKTALLELGFEFGMELTSQQERAYLQSGYEFSFDSRNGRNLLELQWQILPRFYAVDFNVDGLFARAVPQNVAGVALRTLCGEDLLLVLCVHAAKHAWTQLSWLCDLTKLTIAPELDWDVVWRQATALGIRRMIAVTFTLAHRALRTPLPPDMPRNLDVDSIADHLVPLIQRSTRFDTESLAYFRLMASLRERPRDRARLWWRLATTPTVGEWSTVRLPAPLFPLYHAVRVLRLARRIL